MEAKKLKEKLHEVETQNSASSNFCPADPTYSPLPKKKKTKKKKIMQLESKKKEFKGKPKKLKSKGKQVKSNNSKKSKSMAHKRTRYTDMYDDVEAKFIVMERADKLLARLGNGLPHFVKCMLPSNVSHGFWLHLPKKFCSLYLPSHDTSIVLVDEWGNEYKTSYLLGRHGLSAGWRGFSISHRLIKGDILIFHLTEPCKLKVHVVRVNGFDVVGAALCLMNLVASRRGTDCDVVKKDKRKKTKFVEPFLPDISTHTDHVKVKDEVNSIEEPVTLYQSASTDDGFSSEGFGGSEIADRPQPNDLLCYSGTSFLRNRPRELLTCT